MKRTYTKILKSLKLWKATTHAVTRHEASQDLNSLYRRKHILSQDIKTLFIHLTKLYMDSFTSAGLYYVTLSAPKLIIQSLKSGHMCWYNLYY